MPSPTRTLLKLQAAPECVTVPEPLAATPRSLPLRLLKPTLRSPLPEKPRPSAAKAKPMLPGRSSRSAPGLMPVTRPASAQVWSGDQTTWPVTLACPSYRSISAGSKLKLFLSSVPLSSTGITGSCAACPLPRRCTA